jgi:hypothetical protein
MTYERFLKITMQLKQQDELLSELYTKQIDLVDFVDPYNAVITELIKEVYGDEGYDWWSWFCYENEYGSRGFEAWDENKNLICQSFESLWEYLEKIKPEKK